MEDFLIEKEVEFEKTGDNWLGDIEYRINGIHFDDTFLIDGDGNITSKHDDLTFFMRFEKGRKFIEEAKILFHAVDEIVKSDTFLLVSEAKLTNDLNDVFAFELCDVKSVFGLRGAYSVESKSYRNGLSVYELYVKNSKSGCHFSFSSDGYPNLVETVKNLLKKESKNRLKIITNGGEFWNKY